MVAGECGHGHHHHGEHHHHGHETHDHHHLKLALLPVPATGEAALRGACDKALRFFANAATDRASGVAIEPAANAWRLDLQGTHAHFPLRVPAAGHYALITEHAPEEYHLSIKKPDGSTQRPALAQHFEHGHSHDDAVTSVGIQCEGAVDSSLFSGWMSAILSTQGNDLYRCKGILNVAGRDARYVFQGVHMVLDGRETSAWGDSERSNALVFIGRNLNRQRLNEGFKACLRQVV